MKKVLTVLILVLCISFAFAIDVKPYLVTLDLHPLVLSGFFPTYAGVGVDISAPNDPMHAKVSLSGGVYERGFFQNPNTGEYISVNHDPVQLTDLLNVELEAKAEYHSSELSTFTLGYWGIYEKRNVWDKNKTTERWLGGEEKTVLSTSIAQWVDSLRGNNVYPELGTDASIYHTIKVEYEYNKMFDNMLANDGYLVNATLVVAPGFMNSQASMVSGTCNLVMAKNFFDTKLEGKFSRFALSLIDRINFNFTRGSVPAYFQESMSLGRRVRGFDTASFANDTSIVNNLELRLSGPAVADNIFLRTDFFIDMGYGFGNRVNTHESQNDLLASIGIQEMIDYNDVFDLGIEVAYLLSGSRMSNPTHPLQIGATFFLDF